MPLISPSWPYATVALKKSPTRPCDLICATQTREGTERSGLAPPFCGTTVLPRCLSQSHERVTGSSIKFLRCSRCAALRNSALGRSNRRPFHLGNNLRKRRVWCSGLDLNQHLRFADQNRRCDSALSPLSYRHENCCAKASPYSLAMRTDLRKSGLSPGQPSRGKGLRVGRPRAIAVALITELPGR
jgi:hypothetical protein